MKSTFLILSVGLLLSLSTQAQKKKTVTAPKVDVPENVAANFKNEFASVQDDINWSKNYSGNFIANFNNPASLKQTVEYSNAGNLIKTKTFYDVTALPQNITTAMQKNYADANVTECAKVEIPGVASYYAVKITTKENKQKQLLISEEGTVTE